MVRMCSMSIFMIGLYGVKGMSYYAKISTKCIIKTSQTRRNISQDV
jgi:hypothetical protein